jgi:hypothetical protein
VVREAASADIAMPARAISRAEIPHRRDSHRILQKNRILEKVTMPDAVSRADTKRRLLPMRSKILHVIPRPPFFTFAPPLTPQENRLTLPKVNHASEHSSISPGAGKLGISSSCC